MTHTLLPRFIPTRTFITLYISGIPGPPFGPSLRITTTSPSCTCFALIPINASCSLSYIFAGPLNKSAFSGIADGFVTAPSGAIFPFNTAIPPRLCTGLDKPLITSVFLFLNSSIFSFEVCPVHVIPSNINMEANSFIITGIPPAS